MRFSSSASLLASSAIIAMTATIARADPYELAISAAYGQVNCARQEFLLYRNVVSPHQGQQLDAAIELAQTEVEMLRRRLREYAPLDKFQTGRALSVTIDATRLHLLDAEQRQADLERQRAVSYRLRRLKLQTLLSNVVASQAQLAALTVEQGVQLELGQEDAAFTGR